MRSPAQLSHMRAWLQVPDAVLPKTDAQEMKGKKKSGILFIESNCDNLLNLEPCEMEYGSGKQGIADTICEVAARSA